MKMRLRQAAAALTLVAGTQLSAQTDRSILPIPPAPFDGKITETVGASQPRTPHPIRAPQGAPNILLVMSDDVGFAMSSVFGGPVPTPNYARLAASGQSYGRFYMTGLDPCAASGTTAIHCPVQGQI